SQTEHLHHQGLISYRGHHHDRQQDFVHGQCFQDVNPVHIRQMIVQQQHIVLPFVQASQTFLPGVNHLEFKVRSVKLEVCFRQVSIGRVIFGVEHTEFLCHGSPRIVL